MYIIFPNVCKIAAQLCQAARFDIICGAHLKIRQIINMEPGTGYGEGFLQQNVSKLRLSKFLGLLIRSNIQFLTKGTSVRIKTNVD